MGSVTNSVKWTTSSSVLKSIVQLLQVSILARFFLDSSDFGLLAIAQLVITFTDIFLELGLSVALFHTDKISQRQFSSLFWVNIALSIVLYLIIFIITPFITSFYNSPELIKIIPLLSLNLVFYGIGRLYKTMLEKRMLFRFISVIEIISYILILALSLTLAYNGFKVYSIVIPSLVAVFFCNCCFFLKGYQYSPLKIVVAFREVTVFFKIGGFQLGSRLLDFFSNQADVLIIGKLLGNEILGVYNLIKQLVYSLGNLLNTGLNNVQVPYFAKFRDDETLLLEKFRMLVQVNTSLNSGVFFLVSLTSSFILNLIYGDAYIGYSLILTCISVQYSLNALGSPIGALSVVKGRTDLGFYWTILRVLATAICVTIAAQYSITIVSFALLGLALITPFFYAEIVLKRLLSINLLEYLKLFLPTFLVGSILFLTLRFVNSTADILPNIMFGALYFLVYSGFVYLWNKDIIELLLSKIKNR